MNRHDRRAAEAQARKNGHSTMRKTRRTRKRAARVLGEARELIARNGWLEACERRPASDQTASISAAGIITGRVEPNNDSNTLTRSRELMPA
jgi:hypothetical protein